MALQIYNSLTRKKERFVPGDPDRVTMYVCGPTVYNYAHIGNARPAVAFDLLFRVLKLEYANVIYARNITDVEDKIIKAAAENDEPIDALTERFTNIYLNDMAALGVGEPTLQPKATEHIPEMIAMIAALIERDHAYAKDGHVLFNVTSYDAYGALSGRDRDEMIAGARVEVAPYKKDPADFVLWKPSADDQPGWDSPWGRGRPGWHLECSAMIETHLGETFDIHGGGHDLQFPHHENEIAQGTCAHDGALYCRYWMHNGFVNIDSEKMSKSIGNVLLVHDLIEQFPGEVIRLALLTAHYRQPLDWTDAALEEARKTLDRLYGALRNLADVHVGNELTDEAIPQPIIDALRDDLNTPKALAELHALIKQANIAVTEAEKRHAKNALLNAGRLLGFGQDDPEQWFGASDEDAGIDALVDARNAARAAKDWAEADRIRDELAAMNVVMEDGAGGTTWRRTA